MLLTPMQGFRGDTDEVFLHKVSKTDIYLVKIKGFHIINDIITERIYLQLINGHL